MANFILNKIIKIIPSDPPWINNVLKRMRNRQTRLFKNYKKHGFQPVGAFRKKCDFPIQKAKDNYLTNLGNKLIDPNTSQKSNWKIINKVMNKCKAPKIPSNFINNKFVVSCKEKANEFVKYFPQ